VKQDVIRQSINAVALIVTLAVNFLSESLPLNGQTSAEIANRLPILFVPANYVFGIWGIIYALLIGFGIYQLLPSQRENPLLRKISYWFALSCGANSIWLILFHYDQFALSMIAMVLLLVALIMIYTRIEVGRKALMAKETWLIHIPFSTYLGWITVATVANATYVLYDAGWDGFGISGEAWATIMLVVATGITLAAIYTRSDIAYTIVIVWAFVGITAKQSETPLVAVTAAVMALILVLALVGRRFMNRDGRPGPARTGT
jgi:benzodiazapine receptor